MNEKIAEAATSWSPTFPGRKDVPRHVAVICRCAMSLARHVDVEPEKMLHKACKIHGYDPSEIYEILER